MNLLFVMIGGFFGAISRFALGEWIHTSNGFPLGTLFINLIGCFFLGWFLTFVSQKKKIRPEFTLLIGTGFVGSFTTFSTFSVETLNLIAAGSYFSRTPLCIDYDNIGVRIDLFRSQISFITKKEHVMYDDMDDRYRWFFRCRS